MQCEKCWDGICSCGWEYKHFTKEDLVRFINGVLSYHEADKEYILENINKD